MRGVLMSCASDTAANEPSGRADRLAAFLATPPADGWRYAGYRCGGHEVSWRGELAGIGPAEVRFHVHFTGRTYEGHPDWRYGGAWLSAAAAAAELNVHEARELHGALLPVVQQHWVAMLDAETASRAARSA
jgi:hypothetical protein